MEAALSALHSALRSGSGDALAAATAGLRAAAEAGEPRLPIGAALSAFSGAAAACGALQLSNCAEQLAGALAVPGDADGRALRYFAHWCPLLLLDWAEQAERALASARHGAQGAARAVVCTAGAREARLRPAGGTRWPLSGEGRLRGGESVALTNGRTGAWAECVMRQPPADPAGDLELLVLASGGDFAKQAQDTAGTAVWDLHVLCARLPFERQMDALAAVVTGEGCDAALREAILALDPREQQQQQQQSAPPEVEVLSALPYMVQSSAEGEEWEGGARGGSGKGGAAPLDAALNPPQRAAVSAALSRRLMLVQGPPGTGKTRTSVAVVRGWLAAGHKLVLATADSNAGVDNLLSALDAGGVRAVRCGVTDSVPERLRHLCVDRDGSDARRALSAGGVVCTTLSFAAGALLRGLPFTACVIDEAAQATEPAALCALLSGCAQLCLVGDHKQLPATVLSQEAQRRGLGRSLFERLADSGCKVRMLTRQFRMHPALALYPSRQFYNSRLLSAVRAQQRRPPEWLGEAPLRFLPVRGSERREGPSLANAEEAAAVAQVVTRLLARGGCGLQGAEVGVVTPYAAQTRLLRRMVPADVEVGTADSYQGREKEAIVVSPVRSGGSVSAFAGDPRRLNVALTRARKALVVVGDPDTLQRDAAWGDWLRFVTDAGLFEGRQPGDAAARRAVLSAEANADSERVSSDDGDAAAEDDSKGTRKWVRHYGDEGGLQYSIAVSDLGSAWLLDSGAVVDKGDCVDDDGKPIAAEGEQPAGADRGALPGDGDATPPEDLAAALRRALAAAAAYDASAAVPPRRSRWAWALGAALDATREAGAVVGDAEEGDTADARREAAARRVCAAVRWLRAAPRRHCIWCRRRFESDVEMAKACPHSSPAYLPPPLQSHPAAETASGAYRQWAASWRKRTADAGGAVPEAKRLRVEVSIESQMPSAEEQRWRCEGCGQTRLLGSAASRRTRRAPCGKCKTKMTFHAEGEAPAAVAAPAPAVAPAAAPAAISLDDDDDDCVIID